MLNLHTIPSLSSAADRLAVVEALYRFAAGVGLADWDLFASAVSEDVVSDYRPA